MKINKAAMFGLDARIALAIFGALSVISGAALYSAIQKSKVVALASEIQEISKAIEAYMLDVGSDLANPTNTTFSYRNLVQDPSVPGWNGPYFPLTEGINTNGWSVNHAIYGGWLIRTLEDPLGAANYSSSACSVAPCYY